MKFFNKSFPEATVPIKMHVLEDHAIPWANSTHVGFGLLGEQGAELTDIVLHLLCIVKEHLISMAPQVVTAIPTTKEKKLTYTSQGNMKILSAFGYMYMSAGVLCPVHIIEVLYHLFGVRIAMLAWQYTAQL